MPGGQERCPGCGASVAPMTEGALAPGSRRARASRAAARDTGSQEEGEDLEGRGPGADARPQAPARRRRPPVVPRRRTRTRRRDRAGTRRATSRAPDSPPARPPDRDRSADGRRAAARARTPPSARCRSSSASTSRICPCGPPSCPCGRRRRRHAGLAASCGWRPGERRGARGRAPEPEPAPGDEWTLGAETDLASAARRASRLLGRARARGRPRPRPPHRAVGDRRVLRQPRRPRRPRRASCRRGPISAGTSRSSASPTPATSPAPPGRPSGKIATGLRVVDAGGRPPGYLRAFVRAALGSLGVLAAGAGLIPMLLDPARRALHDRVVKTRVVKH